jgi:phage terminase large subunit
MPKNPSSDPVRFAESVFGVELWQTQKEILRAVETERRVAVKACHANGKTFAAAIAALRFAVRHSHSRVITLAPGWLTTRAVIWSEIHSLLARARLRLPTTVLNQTEIRLGPDNLILGLSTNDPTRLQGHHAEHLLIIADEAPGIEPSFWPAVEGILASGDSHLLRLGNPTVSAGYFFDSFGRAAAGWTRFSISAFDTPNLAGVTLEQLLAMDDAELEHDPTPYLTTRRWV